MVIATPYLDENKEQWIPRKQILLPPPQKKKQKFKQNQHTQKKAKV